MVKNQDNDLQTLRMQFVKCDKINKIANAVMDRGCQEIGEEIEVFELRLLKYALYLCFSACAGLYDKYKLKPRD